MESIESLQAALADSKRKVEKLKREKRLNFDPRLNFFARNNGSTDDEKLTNDAKIKAKNIFTDGGTVALRCVICGKVESHGTPITAAHIVSSAMRDYSVFGIENGYKDNLDVFSERNCMPLCGTHGQEGTCHDAMDKHLIHIRYDPILQSYHVDCSPGASEYFHDLRKRALTTPPGWNPYRRLLAWRSRKCGTEYGFVPDFERFETMNKISENSKSIGDAEDDGL